MSHPRTSEKLTGYPSSIKISGNYVIIGANAGVLNYDSIIPDTVYIYNVTTGKLVHTIQNPNDYNFSDENSFFMHVENPRSGLPPRLIEEEALTILTPAMRDDFGLSVGIFGNNAIVGAPAEDISPHGIPQYGESVVGIIAESFEDSNWFVNYNRNDLVMERLTTLKFYYTEEEYEEYRGPLTNMRKQQWMINGQGVRVVGFPLTSYVTDDGVIQSQRPAVIQSVQGRNGASGDWFDLNFGEDYYYRQDYFNSYWGGFEILKILFSPSVNSWPGGASSVPQFNQKGQDFTAVKITYAYRMETSAGADVGRVYSYNVTTGKLVHTIQNPNPTISKNFGKNLSISGNYFVATTNGFGLNATSYQGDLIHIMKASTENFKIVSEDGKFLITEPSQIITITNSLAQNSSDSQIAAGIYSNVVPGLPGDGIQVTVTTNSSTNSVQTGTNWSVAFNLAANPEIAGVPSLTTTGTNIGLSGTGNTAGGDGRVYSTIAASLAQIGGTNVSVGSNATTTFRTSSVYTSNPGTTVTFVVTVFIQNFGFDNFGSSAAATYASGVFENQTTTSSTAVAVNKTGNTIIVNGVEYADNAEIGIIGENASGATTTWTVPPVTISTLGYVETTEDLSYILNQQFTDSLSTLGGALVHTITPPESVLGGFISAEMSSNYIITRLRIPNPNNSLGNNRQTGYYVQIYKTTTGDWTDTELLHTINQDEQHENGEYGYALAISNDYFVVGDYRAMKVFDKTSRQALVNSTDWRYGNGSGKVFVYDTITGNLLHTLTNPNDSRNALFGFKVAISGKYIIVSAPDEYGIDFRAPIVGIYDTEEELLSRSKEPRTVYNKGIVYVYDATTGELVENIENRTSIGSGRLEKFGSNLAIDGRNVLIAIRQQQNSAYAEPRVDLFGI
jgi:hypothetical protein